MLRANNQMMQQQSLACQAALLALTNQQEATATAPAKTKPSIEFSSWDGEPSTLRDFLFWIKMMKKFMNKSCTGNITLT
jgi:hypothetical protein